MSAKKKKKTHGCLIMIFAILVIVFIWWFNTYTLKETDVKIYSTKILNAVKIVQLTDLHGATFGTDNSTLIKKIEKISPDFILVTGDMYSAGDEKGKETAINLISKLAAKFDVYFVNGEHDDNESYMKKLTDAGVNVMDYKYKDIFVKKTKIRLYGISNVYYSSTFDLNNAFTFDSSKFNLLIAHIENYDAFSKSKIDLSVCGDTHGGQIRLPIFGAIYSNGIWLPECEKLGNNYCVKGLYGSSGSQLFISSGLGNYPIPVRFLDRPEIAVINLLPQL